MPDDQNCPRSLADRVVALLNTEFSQAEQTVAEITARYEAAAKKTGLISQQLDRQRKDGEASRETASAWRDAAAANPGDPALTKAVEEAEADVKAAEAAIAESEAAIAAAEKEHETAARELSNAWRLASNVGRQLEGLKSAVSPNSRRTNGTAWSRVDYTFSAFLLLIVVALAAMAAIVFFTAAQFQGRMADYQINGVPLSVWRLEQIVTRKLEVEDKLQGRVNFIDLMEKRRSTFFLNLEDKKARVSASELQFKEHLESVFSQARNIDNGLATQLTADKPIESIALIRGSQNLRSNPTITSAVVGLETEYGKVAADRYEVAELQAQIDGLTARIEAEKTSADQGVIAVYQILGITVGAADAATTRERIENLISEMQGFQESVRGTMYKMTKLPREVVILLLVLSMGVLGSALYMVSQFEEDYQQFSWAGKILRPGLGAVTALVLYIVVKAGILVVGDASRLGGNAPVNPYFIAFLAIIAGFMSENALAAIRTVGSSFLTRGANSSVQRRWAISDLTPNLARTGKTAAQLAAHLAPLSVEEVAEILSGKRDVDPHGQAVIGAFFNTDPRGMFTDRAPAK